jgi:hypothetical protein
MGHDYFPFEEKDFENNTNSRNNFSHIDNDIVFRRFSSENLNDPNDCSTFTIISLE